MMLVGGGGGSGGDDGDAIEMKTMAKSSGKKINSTSSCTDNCEKFVRFTCSLLIFYAIFM